MKKSISICDPKVLRAIKGDPRFVNAQLCPTKRDGHKYDVGETRTLTGLVDFPEYNGEKVTIAGFWEDGFYGKAYYIDGRITEVINWVYEFRLK